MAQTKVLDPTGYTHAGSKIAAEIVAQVADSSVAPQAGITSLVDDTGGTASGTLAVIGGTTYATDGPNIKNAFATLVAQVNDITVKLTAAGVLES